MDNMDITENIKIQITALTKSLRDDIDLQGLRNCLIAKGLELEKTLQVTYFETEDKIFYGIIVNNKSQVFQYEYSINPDTFENHLDLLDITTDKKNHYYSWPEVTVALDMIKKIYG